MSMDVYSFHESLSDTQFEFSLPNPNIDNPDSIASPDNFKTIISRAIREGARNDINPAFVFDLINDELVRYINDNKVELGSIEVGIPNFDTMKTETGRIEGIELPKIDDRYLDVLTRRGVLRFARSEDNYQVELELDDQDIDDILSEQLENAGDVLQAYFVKKFREDGLLPPAHEIIEGDTVVVNLK